ncbi:MAG TPA: response regulator [Verrucomicrobiota bacterium]|nr:response regulator [Verrucomicrobiota bacterium]HNT13658.1 response regulator [Verrucomicrobiota bacterium]
MPIRLGILLVEDNPADAAAIARELERTDFACVLTRVQSETDFRRELMLHPPDLILADGDRQIFDGFRALAITLDLAPSLPFIFVSASNDQRLVERMFAAGAAGYIFKRDLHDLKAVLEYVLAESAGPPAAEAASLTVPAARLAAARHDILVP